MKVNKCDRCGRIISLDDGMDLYDAKKHWWRYDIEYDAHPYPAEKLDLCINCKKDLYKWIKGVDKYAEK